MYFFQALTLYSPIIQFTKRMRDVKNFNVKQGDNEFNKEKCSEITGQMIVGWTKI